MVSKHRRAGLSLLEVILALSLTVLLIAAISGAMHRYWRMTVAGQVETERAQLARALQRQMTLDLRRVMYKAKAAEEEVAPGVSASSAGTGTGTGSGTGSGSGTGTGTGTGTGSTDSSGDATTVMSISSTTDQLTQGSAGIQGDAVSLKLHLSIPSTAWQSMPIAAEGEATVPTQSDLRQVTYYVTGAGGTSAPANAAGAAAASGGLARFEGDRLAATLSEETNSAALPAGTKILAGEVTSVQFRYFDGSAWLTEWNSIDLGYLPRAVEVTLQFAPAENRLGNLYNTGVRAGTETLRFVVAVPVSDPTPADMQL